MLKRFRAIHLMALAGTALIIVALVFGTLVSKWPFTEQSVSKMLSKRAGRQVQIGTFQKTYFPPGFVAGDIKFLRHNHPDKQPLIQIEKLVVAGGWMDLITFNRIIPQVDVYRMRILLPPRGVASDGQHHELMPLNTGKSNLGLSKINVHGATLDFLPGKGDSEPFRLEIRDLVLSGVGDNKPFGFDAVVENTLPHAEIHSKGIFGPWSAEEPSATPVKGSFTMQNVQLRDIPGISGRLQSQGTFEGTLDRLETDGNATVPDFHVLSSSHIQSVKSIFHASLDATQGNVTLRQLDTTFGHTTVHTEGSITGEEHQKGKTTILKATVSEGRVEDLTKLFIVAKNSPLTGHVVLQTSIRLPPGGGKFLERLEMAGNFRTSSSRFTNANTQGMLNRLKESAQGESKEDQNNDTEKVASTMTSHVVVKGGIAHITDLLLTAPDTMVRMDGTYNLLSKQVDINGTLKTDGKLSDTQTGFKAFAVKLITPFLKKQKSTVVPFEMKGTYGSVSAHLDLDGARKL